MRALYPPCHMELTVFVFRKVSGQQQAITPGLMSLDMSQCLLVYRLWELE